eukprot:jgi/Ulvmu1/8724/UM047_0065.1
MADNACLCFIRLCTVALTVTLLVWVPLAIDASPSPRTAKRQAVRKIITAHKEAQDYVEAALDQHENLEDVVCRTPTRAGFLSKNSSAHLSVTMKDRSSALEFIQAGIPIYDSCQVYVSDTWKFIYIRQPKASSSTMLQAIRSQLCGGRCKPPHFYQEQDKNKFLPKWESYFVFTVVRNPWTRALSAYSMFNRGFLYKRSPQEPLAPPKKHCGLPFLNYSADVWAMRDICASDNCCAFIRRVQRWVPNFVDAHVSDHGHCMFLPGGEPLVDYIGTSEDFAASWADILGEINRRVGTAFAAAPTKSMNGHVDASGASEHSCSGTRVAHYYNSTTARNVALQYALDIVQLGYL